MPDADSPTRAEDLEKSAAGCRRFLMVVVAVPALGAGVYFAYDFISHQQVESEWTVQGQEWSRTVAVTSEGVWSDALWCTNMRQEHPTAVDVKVTRKQRGSEKIKTGETCTGKAPNKICHDVYADRGLTDDWCEFTWTGRKPTRQLVSEGASASPAPTWPELGLAAEEREGDRSERYVVTLRSGEREKSCDVAQERWSEMAVGSVWKAEHKRGSGKMNCDTLRR